MKYREIRLKVLLPVSADIEGAWMRLMDCGRVSLGAEASKYAIYFTGTTEEGVDFMTRVLTSFGCDVECKPMT